MRKPLLEHIISPNKQKHSVTSHQTLYKTKMKYVSNSTRLQQSSTTQKSEIKGSQQIKVEQHQCMSGSILNRGCSSCITSIFSWTYASRTCHASTVSQTFRAWTCHAWTSHGARRNHHEGGKPRVPCGEHRKQLQLQLRPRLGVLRFHALQDFNDPHVKISHLKTIISLGQQNKQFRAHVRGNETCDLSMWRINTNKQVQK